MFVAASASSAMNSGSPVTPGGLMPSGEEAKKEYKSR